MTFSLQLDVTAQGPSFRVLHFSPGTTTWDLGRVVLTLAQQLLQPDNRALTAAAPSPELVARDYPAVMLHVPSSAYLCAACADAYEGVLEMLDDAGPSLIKLPASPVAVPCSYHLTPARAPVDAERAAEIQNNLDEAAGRVIVV